MSSADESVERIKEVVNSMAPVGVYKKDKFNESVITGHGYKPEEV
jgi:hypothetical protein